VRRRRPGRRHLPVPCEVTHTVCSAPMSHVHDTIQEFAKMLLNLDQWIDKAVEHAKARSFDKEVFVSARLAPDQYSFDQQVQLATDAAKFCASYLSGREVPKHPDDEKTIAELKARLTSVRAVLESFDAASFAGAEERRVSPPWMEGKWIRGDHYLQQVAAPNFFFHVTTAYAILRHNGVSLGKVDFIGALPMRG
jgi:hypothetical protein